MKFSLKECQTNGLYFDTNVVKLLAINFSILTNSAC